MKEKLIILEIPEPQDDGAIQKPTRDVPNGRGHKLDERLVVSSQTPDDIQRALEQLPEGHKSSETKIEP